MEVAFPDLETDRVGLVGILPWPGPRQPRARWHQWVPWRRRGVSGSLTCRIGCAEAMRQSVAPQSSQLRYTPFSRMYCSPEKLVPS